MQPSTASGWGSSNADTPEPGDWYYGTSGTDWDGVANSFVSPINNNPASGTPTVNAILYPNNAVRDIEHTVTGINWAPGAELWIRWRDTLGAHDGIAIDNVRFTASASAVVPLLGDFNSDGKVDAGDYVTWRKNEVANATLPNDNGLTDQADRYTLWRANFGNPAGAGSGAGLEGANVPEPSAIALVLFCLAVLPLKRNRVR